MPTVPQRTVSLRDIELVLRGLGGRALVSRIKDKVEDIYGVYRLTMPQTTRFEIRFKESASSNGI